MSWIALGNAARTLADRRALVLKGAGKRARPLLASRWYRPIAFGLTVFLLIWAGVLFEAIAQGAVRRDEVGWDATLFARIGRHFLDTGQAYYPIQLAGRYPGEGTVNLYPPLALYLFVPFAFLPLILWWIVPLGVLGWHLWDCRPQPWTWPVLALFGGLLPTVAALLYGGTTLWSMAFIAVGLRHPWVAALVAFKPSDAVMWLVFARRPSFWRALPVVALMALPFGTLWLDWITIISNLEGTAATRNLTAIPMLLLPVVAWVGRTGKPDMPHAAGDRAQRLRQR